LNPSDKKKFVDAFLKALKETKIDIRKFNITQLEKAVHMIQAHS
jgi:hypothetical protein